MVDIKNKKCKYVNCNKQPFYNFPTEKIALLCNKHKKETMIDVRNKKCQYENCNARPNFNFAGKKIALFCNTHKKEGMLDVIHKKCKNDFCDTRSTPKYKGYCYHCFVHEFPNEPVSRNYKTKEKEVVNFISKQFPDEKWIFDKQISDGCSRRRPDMLLDCKTHHIVVEIDENQHVSYDSTCDNKRTVQIYQDLGQMNLVFIRFNPDDYIDKSGNKVKSPWSLSKTKVLSISKKHEVVWKQRLWKLKFCIDLWMEQIPDKAITVIQMFYDENSKSSGI